MQKKKKKRREKDIPFTRTSTSIGKLKKKKERKKRKSTHGETGVILPFFLKRNVDNEPSGGLFFPSSA